MVHPLAKTYKKQPLVLKLTAGGMGDTIACMPVVRHFIKSAPYHDPLYVVVYDQLVDLYREFFKESHVTILSASFYNKHKLNYAGLGARVPNHTYHSTLSTHLVDYAFNVIADHSVPLSEKNYPQISYPHQPEWEAIQGKYAVVCSNFTAPVRQMPISQLHWLIQYIKSQGLEVVLLGQRNLFVDGEQTIKSNPIKIFEDVIDLRDASPLLESLKIINYAKFIVGVDNGLFHLAGLTQTPIVAGYTTVAPELRMPYRNNKLGWNVGPCVPQSEWRFCQSATTIPYQIEDFRFCNKPDQICDCVLKIPTSTYKYFIDIILEHGTLEIYGK